MSSRRVIYAMFAAGLVVVLVLTFIPYSLLTRARQAVVSVISPPDVSSRAVEQPQGVTPPALDVERWYAEHDERPELHGVLVETADRRALLADHNADKTFNPASLIKLATTLLVLKRLGPDHRFETRVYTEGETDEATKTLKGRVFVSSADPTFGDHAASLVARGLRERGVERLDGEIVVTDGFSFNYNEKPEESAPLAAKVMGMKEKGTAVGEAPAGAPLFVLRSYTLREILLYMNAHSSNFVAEQLCARVGGPEGLRNFIVGELGLSAEQVEIARCSGRERNRMSARGVLAVLRALDDEAARHGMRLEDLMPVASDDAGTLRRRLEGGPLDGALVGKTGTLTAEVDGGMASLAGVVYTERAGKIYFAILDQGSRISENRELEDLLLAQLILAQDIPRPLPQTEERRRLLPSTSLTVSDE
ncbi:MAG TPA: D-alanyl-D-alanine carboxypeptidase [Pyrinomonadaceae bacterium]|nr:D-alanyl-D-alanine carboxypeptidase [Pyrinomonadaceae bacterium]